MYNIYQKQKFRVLHALAHVVGWKAFSDFQFLFLKISKLCLGSVFPLFGVVLLTTFLFESSQ